MEIRKSFELCHASAMAFRRRFPREKYNPLPKGGRRGIMFPKDREEYLKWLYD